MKSIPTVLIETENGPVRINETDFDEATMTLAGSEPEDDPVTDETPPAETPPAETPPAETPPAQRMVLKEGRKHFVVDAAGVKITGEEGIDEKGYTTEKAAWDAILAASST